MNHPGGAERRGEGRQDVSCRVVFRVLKEGKAEPRTTAGETANLSATGLCLVTSRELEKDAHVAMEISLEGEADVVVAMGRVVWSERHRNGHRAGVAFAWVRDEDRKALAAIAEFLRTRREA
ncbi:MAG: PilZ domain-containing protein [Planctomycetota bacterium]